MRRLLMLIVTACLMWAPASARAEELTKDPIIYVFWAQSCPHSQAAMRFLARWKHEEPALKVRDYEVESSLVNAIVLGRLLDKIGVRDVQLVPILVIGDDLTVGFQDDETTGRSLKEFMASCRAKGCPDRIKDLLPVSDEDAAPRLTSAKRPVCRTESQHHRLGGR